MKTLVLDVEASGANKAHTFGKSNVLCCIGLFDGVHYSYLDIEHSSLPYNLALQTAKQAIEQADIIIGHNLKYDLNWLKRYTPKLNCSTVWDTQLFEYIASNQNWIMPSLSDSLVANGLPAKSDLIKTEYWDKGLTTMQVPAPLLREYNEGDCRGTYNLYLKQLDRLKLSQAALFQLHCDDLLVLQEMEFNGMMFDVDEAIIKQQETEVKYNNIIDLLMQYIPCAAINWNSNDHLSVVLYGGNISVPIRETVVKHYKKGDKNVERWSTKKISFPRIVTPLANTERDKEGFWLVNEPILRSLKPQTSKAKRIIELVLELSEVEKLLTTYYIGLPKLISQMDWEPGVIHGQLNQCVTRTGRSSASKPNQQNFAGVIKPLFKSRYSD